MLDNDSALSFMKKLENIMGMSIIGSRDILIACLLGTLSCSAMGDSPKRAMPFLCKNSVVTEAPDQKQLLQDVGNPKVNERKILFGDLK